MPELTPELLALGATGFSGDIPIGPDGTPVLRQNQAAPEPVPQGNPVLEQIIAQQGLVAGEAPGGGPSASPDPIGYGYGPFYAASSQDYPENRTPLAPPVWNLGMGGEPPPGAMNWEEPGSWEKFHTPKDQSTGGGFYTADDVFTGQIPLNYQQGAASPSTNNYRLLPPPYNTPQYIMRNGYIIDRFASGAGGLRGPGSAEAGSWIMQHTSPFWSMGSSVTTGWPAGVSYGHGLSFAGWPGASNWASGGYGNQGSA